MKIFAAALIAIPALSGCATSKVSPVSPAVVQKAAAATPAEANRELTRICVIDNPRVANNGPFLEAYRKALEDRGYTVEVVKAGTAPPDCPLTSRYTAYWSWDLVPYMSYAELRVFKDGKAVGQAVFRARGSRFINAELTIKELVEQLLPK